MSRWERFFAGLIHHRWWVVASYAALTPLAIWWALSVPNDSAIERLIVASDPDYQRTQAFHQHFPEGKHAILLFQSDDPFRPDRLQALADFERRLAGVERLQVFSLVSTWLRLNPGRDLKLANDALRQFATKTELFRRQGLVDREFIGIALTLASESGPERDRLLAQIDESLAAIPAGMFSHLRRVGGPYVDSWLERETHQATLQYMPLFGLFVVLLVWFVYRSWRALAALLIALGVSVLLGVAIATPLGFGFTIVSSLVPLTILITSTSTLVYLHSRFVDRPEEVSVERHQLFALSNKLLACTASVFAAAVGFAALAVSEIRPIRELGLWTAGALLITWIVSFTLFPALQAILKTPTGLSHLDAGKFFLTLANHIPLFTYRWRWPLVLSAIALCLLGAGALFGVPGQLQPMQLEVDSLDYIDPDADVHRDTRYFEQKVGGLTTAQLWIRTPEAAIVDPDVLRALDRFADRVQQESGVNSVVGLTTLLRFRRYAAGLGESLPTAAAGVTARAADLEQLLLTEPAFAAFVDLSTLRDTHLTLIGGASGEAGYQRLARSVEAIWSEVQRASPALAGCQLELVGQGLLQAKIAGHLVPTLVESFVLTAGIIFVAFLVVFRSGAARVMAMIPSLFAILAMFLVMRLAGMSLNVATILIASTVLGASENDQIHFFYHFGEKRRSGSVHQSLAHTLRVSGKAIFYATLINASGFLALALSPLPPMRQFGVISASAFLLSMLADFTALPAALWILTRERPDRSAADRSLSP